VAELVNRCPNPGCDQQPFPATDVVESAILFFGEDVQDDAAKDNGEKESENDFECDDDDLPEIIENRSQIFEILSLKTKFQMPNEKFQIISNTQINKFQTSWGYNFC